MKILIEAFWDPEADVWTASSTGEIGLVTEAATIEELQRKLAVMARDLFGDNFAGPIEIELVARSHQTIAA